MIPILRFDLRRTRPRERGSAFIMALFAVLIGLAGTVTILEWGATQRRRDREAEMIWRGEQYKRAIRLYFHKTGHYPQTIDDLKKGLPQLQFLRQAYKDPINKEEDGAWRFIFINGAGQIIGSTRYATLQQMAMIETGQLMPGQQPAIPGQPGVPVSSLVNPGGLGSTQTPSSGGVAGSAPPGSQNPPPDQSGQNPQNPPPDQSSQNPQPPNPPPQTPSGPGGTSLFGQQAGLGPTSTSPGSSTFGNPLTALKPTGPVDGPVLGAFLTGVASKAKGPSLKVYHGGKKYLDWEFIWNPLVDAAAATQQAMSPGGAMPGMPGLPIANPFGGSTLAPGPGSNPNNPNFPQPGPNPSPQPQQQPQQ